MKKALLILALSAALFCLFALCVFAADGDPDVTDTFYVVSSQDSQVALDLTAQGKAVVVLAEIYASVSSTSGNDWIDSFAEGSHIELIFAETIVETVADGIGILLSKEITLTVRYNGFAHLVTNRATKANVFVLKHSGAKINLIGSSQIYDENGNVIKDFTYDSTDLSKNKVEIYHQKVYCWIYDGDAYIEGIRSYTGQELVYVDGDNANADPSVTNTYEYINCALNSASNSIGLLGQASARKYIKISGGYYNSVSLNTICTGSYIRNCEIGNTLFMDCWDINGNMLVVENTKIGGKISTATGRTHFSFYDCDFDLTKLSLGNDGGGSCYALVYTSATCENDGTLNVYKQGKGTTPVNSKDVNNDSRYASTVSAFYADPANLAFGHDYSDVSYFSGEKYSSSFFVETVCANCGNVSNSASAEAIFVSLGYSVPEFGSSYSITLGFMINRQAITDYENLTDTTLNYGFIVALEKKLGTDVPPLDSEGNEVVLEGSSVIKVDLTKEPNSFADLKVLLSEEYGDTSILMCLYVIEASESSIEINYLQGNGTTVSTDGFSYVSYNNH